MNKRLNLTIIWNMCTNLTNLFQRKFSGRNDSFGSQFIPEPISFIVSIIRLGTDVALNLRTNLFCNGKDTRICNNQCIWMDLSQFPEILFYPFQIVIVGENIRCHINFYASGMCELNSFFHFFHRKIFCFGSQPKSLTTNIYCICPEYNSCL